MNFTTSNSPWITLAILRVIVTMVSYVETMTTPAIPDIIKDFQIPYSTSAWILTVYLVSAAVMTPVLGKLSDIYGRQTDLKVLGEGDIH